MKGPEFERVPTGIAGLDRITHGGFFEGGLYLVEGTAGAGKTTLADQLAFHHARTGGRALYVTLLGESHGKMVEHLRSFAFLDETRVSESVTYLSGYRSLLERGLRGFLEMLAHTMRDQRPSLLLIDGFRAFRHEVQSDDEVAQFIHDLNTLVSTVGVTTVMISPSSANRTLPEHTLVDGLVELTLVQRGLRRVREIEVYKLRGTAHLDGRHLFTITADDGLCVYPRLEAAISEYAPVARESRARMAFDVPRLDEMLHGGLLDGSTTSLFGAPGAGKAIFGLEFLEAGARAGEPGLYFGFYETPDRLIGKAEGIGIRLRDAADAGLIEMIWHPPLEDVMDRLAYRLLDAVQRRSVRRLVVDGVEGFRDAAAYPERAQQSLTALTNRLRAGGVTSLFTEEAPLFTTAESGLPLSGLSAIMENIILLRYVELDAQLHRLISVIKVRESGYDSAAREFTIGDHGVEVAESFASAVALLRHGVGAAGSGPGGPGAKPERASGSGGDAPTAPRP